MVGEARLGASPAFATSELGLDRQLVEAVRGLGGRLAEPAQERARVVEVAEVPSRPARLGELREEFSETLTEPWPSPGKSLGDFAGSFLEQDSGLGFELARVEAAEKVGSVFEVERVEPGLAVCDEARALRTVAQESPQGGNDVEAHGALAGAEWRWNKPRSRSS